MTVFESPEGYRYELYHLGYRPGDVAGLQRVTDGHGPLEDTGRLFGGRRVVRCKNPQCIGQWEAWFSEIRAVTAQEKVDEYGAQAMSIERIVTTITSPDSHTGYVKPTAQLAAQPHMLLLQEKRHKIEQLQTLPSLEPVELAFKGKHSGGLVIRWLHDEAPASQPAEQVPPLYEKDEAPHNKRMTPEERIARRKKESTRIRDYRMKKKLGEKAEMSGESNGDGAARRDGSDAAQEPVGMAR